MTRQRLRAFRKPLLLLLAWGIGCMVLSTQASQTGQAAQSDPLAIAFNQFRQSIADVETAIRQSRAYASDQDRVGGYQHLVRALMKGLEAEVLQDPDFPYFRILDFWLREGGDNPDQRYAFSPIRGGAEYRVWGQLGSAIRLELQLYAGRPWDGSGRSVGYLNFEDIDVAEDGSFEIWLTSQARAGNWMRNPIDATTVFARQIYADWDQAPTGHIHIDRVGFEGARKLADSEAELAQRLENAATMFSTTAKNWPGFVQRRLIEARPVNSVITPIDTYTLGGAKGRWLSSGHFDIADDQALIIRMPQTPAQYQAIQLTDLWYASLEHGNLTSSLNRTQALASDDGVYHFVIATSDPGHPNWLDTGGLNQGTYILRWDGMIRAMKPQEQPSTSLVALKDLTHHVPDFVQVSQEERARVRANRRAHLQRRANR